jgi:hypothetical protein
VKLWTWRSTKISKSVVFLGIDIVVGASKAKVFRPRLLTVFSFQFPAHTPQTESFAIPSARRPSSCWDCS